MIIHTSDYNLNNFHIIRYGNVLDVTVTYPPESCLEFDTRKVTYVMIDQEAVRASGGIRVHFDYARNGFVIEQQTNWHGSEVREDGTVDEQDPQFVEAAFVHAFHPESRGLDE